MGGQVQGLGGWVADRAIRRSVRRSLHAVYWIPPATTPSGPTVFASNHHGWHDGDVMYLALSALGREALFHGWAGEMPERYAGLGGLPFASDDTSARAKTIRQTVRRLREKENLLLFPEGSLHRPPELRPFGKSLDFLARHVPALTTIPIGIRYEISLEDRPECFLMFGSPVEPGPDLGRRTRLAVAALLDRIAVKAAVDREAFSRLPFG